MPPLIEAAKTGKIGPVDELLRRGTDPNQMFDGHTALSFAAYNGNLEVVRLLLKHGADANLGTPLASAVQSGSEKVTAALIEAGADVNVTLEHGVTPLLISINMANSNPHIAILLIQAGANVNSADSDGNSALLIASTESSDEVFETLVKNGAHPNSHNKFGQTALHLMAQNGDAFSIRARLLLEHGASPLVRDNRNRLPLDLVPPNGGVEIRRLLVAHWE